MPVYLAETAGFCFGVNKAVDRVRQLLDEGERVATLGPIIHNPQVVAELEARGVCTVTDPADTPPDSVLVIRSHGVSREVYDRIDRLGLRACDATCPFVAKIHRLVATHSAAGAVVLSDIPDNCTAVGVPARIVRRNGAKIVELDQVHIPDPVSQELCKLQHQIDVLKEELRKERESK